MLETFTCARFEAHLKESFRLQAEADDQREVVLTEATPLSMTPPAGGRGPFSIVFLDASETVLPQRIYRLHHPDLGTFDLFLVPIGRDASGVRYEAVFT